MAAGHMWCYDPWENVKTETIAYHCAPIHSERTDGHAAVLRCSYRRK